MLQVLQNLKNGEISLMEVPVPQVSPGHLLIKTYKTLISSGTERMMLDFGRSGWISKAKQQPDKVKMVLDKVKTDGLLTTIDAVQNKLNQPLALGYCQYGRVEAVGAGVQNFCVGDFVISNGPHAEWVNIPVNLCAKVPEGVDGDEAVFTVLSSIGLHGVRLLNPTLGECFVVTGLGLIGLVVGQILRAHSCRVMGFDFDPQKVEMAKKLGIEAYQVNDELDLVGKSLQFSEGKGVDGVIVTASTQSDEPLNQAAEMCRKKGRVILVGVTGMELNRTLYFKKEIQFQVSCSYGPGRYDEKYEVKGVDYPFDYVRWTEQRNFESILFLLKEKKLDVKSLISHHFPLEKVYQAYDIIAEKKPSLGIVIDYDLTKVAQHTVETLSQSTALLASSESMKKPVLIQGAPLLPVHFVGSGNYAMRVLLPIFKNQGVSLGAVVSRQGLSGALAAKKFGFSKASTSVEEAFLGGGSLVVIATQHDTHKDLAVKALRAGCHVFVEKPLALTIEELDELRKLKGEREQVLMVGFNRRFSPLTQEILSVLPAEAPRHIGISVNAGEIPQDHWTQSIDKGGRRLIGEGCHFIDLARYLANSPICDLHVASLMGSHRYNREENFILSLSHQNGSTSTIQYLANGNKAFPKERVEVFCEGSIYQINNFRELKFYAKKVRHKKWMKQNKGQEEMVAALLKCLKEGGSAPIPWSEICEVTQVSLQAAQALRSL